MKIFLTLLVLSFAPAVSAQNTTSDYEVEVIWKDHEGPILKDRKEILPSQRNPADQNYQVACQNGKIGRCSGTDFSKIGEKLKADKSVHDFPRIEKPTTMKIKLIKDESAVKNSSSKTKATRAKKRH